MTSSTEIIPSPDPHVSQVALFTPVPKAAKRGLKFFAAQIDHDHPASPICKGKLRQSSVLLDDYILYRLAKSKAFASHKGSFVQRRTIQSQAGFW